MKKIIPVAAFLISSSALAWNGYDYDKGSYVEINKENLVREGRDIEIYDYGTGEYKDVEIQSITESGSGAEVEVYDYGTDSYLKVGQEETWMIACVYSASL